LRHIIQKNAAANGGGKMSIVKRKIVGLALFSAGIGMLIGMVLPGWSLIIALALIFLGFNFLKWKC